MQTQTLPQNSVELIQLKIYRLKTGNGIGLYVKSEQIENFIRANTINPEHNDSTDKARFINSNNSGWSNHLGYRIQNREDLRFLQGWGNPIINGNSSNMSFLTVKGLGKGVTFEFEGMYSQSTVDKFLTDVRKNVKQIWNEFIKEKNWVFHATTYEID